MMFAVSAGQFPDGIYRIAAALAKFEIADADRSATSHERGGRKARLKIGHILRALLQGVARRYQPPHFVEPERSHCLETDPPVGPMRRVEGAAKKADARHALALA